MLYLDYKIILT